MVLGDRGIVCIDEFDKMNEIDRVAIHEVMEQQTVTIAKAGIHVSLNARCSVLAAANPIYGEYQKDITASKNIGLPDSLLSRFDLCFIVLDEHDSEHDRRIADRVIRNHMFPAETPTLVNIYDEKIIEPDLNGDDQNEALVFEKYNALIHGSNRREILHRSFLRKYLHYSKKQYNPALTDEAIAYISTAWTKLRSSNDDEWGENFKAVPITVRTLETLIRLATAHAKLRLAKVVVKKDCEIALEMLTFALYNETGKENDSMSLSEDNTKPAPGKRGNKKESPAKGKRNMLVEVDDESMDYEEDESSDRNNNIPSKKVKREKQDDVDRIFSSAANQGPISDDVKKFVFRLIHDHTNRREFQQMSFDELWSIIQKNKESASYRLTTKSSLLDVVLALDTSGKVLYSDDTRDINLI